MNKNPQRYYRHRFPPEIISHAVWLYHRFCLSCSNVEDLLAERGVVVLKSQQAEPLRLVTDKLESYSAAQVRVSRSSAAILVSARCRSEPLQPRQTPIAIGQQAAAS